MTQSDYRLREVVFDGGEWERSASGLLLPPQPPRGRALYGDRPIGIDLFAGCGGFSLGFHSAGWNVIAAAEMDPFAAMTYLYNLAEPTCEMHFVTDADERAWQRAIKQQDRFENSQGMPPETFRMGGNPARTSLLRAGRMDPEVALNEERWAAAEVTTGCEHFWLGDLRKVTGQQMLDALGLAPGDVDAVFGGPPCQGFSLSGKRDVMDPRNSLIFDFCRLVLEIQPKTFVMENVPGMLSMVTPEGIPVFDGIARVMADGGFGTFDGIKRSLLSMAGVGGAFKGARGSKRQISAEVADDEDDPVEAQMSLLEAMA